MLLDEFPWLGQSWPKSARYSCLVCLLIVFPLDYTLTYIGVSSGVADEANPLAAYFMEVLGIGYGLSVFAFLVLVFWSLVLYMRLYLVIAIGIICDLTFAVIPWMLKFNGLSCKPLCW